MTSVRAFDLVVNPTPESFELTVTPAVSLALAVDETVDEGLRVARLDLDLAVNAAIDLEVLS